MSSTFKNIVTLLGLALLAGIGYLAFNRYDTNVPLVNTVSNMATTDVEFATQDLLRQQALLNTFNISGDIFSDPRFVSLTDYRINLIPEPIGRPNPFVPLW